MNASEMRTVVRCGDVGQNGNGGWTWKLGKIRRVLYRLPRVLEAAQSGDGVFVVEGEKDVEALERAGVTATCNPGGAGKWRGGLGFEKQYVLLAPAELWANFDRIGCPPWGVQDAKQASAIACS